jgi:hypothetical protein
LLGRGVTLNGKLEPPLQSERRVHIDPLYYTYANTSPPLSASNRQQKTPSLSDIGILKIFNYFKKQLKLVLAADCYLCGGHLC